MIVRHVREVPKITHLVAGVRFRTDSVCHSPDAVLIRIAESERDPDAPLRKKAAGPPRFLCAVANRPSSSICLG